MSALKRRWLHRIEREPTTLDVEGRPTFSQWEALPLPKVPKTHEVHGHEMAPGEKRELAVSRRDRGTVCPKVFQEEDPMSTREMQERAYDEWVAARKQGEYEWSKAATQYLRALFPEAEANPLNFVLFSTGGVMGSYCTIEEIADAWRQYYAGDPDVLEKYGMLNVTFVIIHPRCADLPGAIKYGNALIDSEDDVRFLLKLRKTSHEAVAKIGLPS